MYTDMFRNIASYEILEVDRSQISEITETVKLPKIALHSLFVSLYVCEASLVLFHFELYSGYIDIISDSCNLIFSSIIILMIDIFIADFQNGLGLHLEILQKT